MYKIENPALISNIEQKPNVLNPSHESMEMNAPKLHKKHINPPGFQGNNVIVEITEKKADSNMDKVPILLSKKKQEVTGKVGGPSLPSNPLNVQTFGKPTKKEKNYSESHNIINPG